jgi:hypothetical protein
MAMLRTTKARRGAIRILLLAALTFAPAARAESDVDRENAQALYKAGNDARDAGDLRAALFSYRGAYALVPTPVIAVALAKAEMALGQLIEARQTLLGVERIPAKPNESVLTTSARAEANALATKIERRIPTVTLEIQRPDGARMPTITLDGATIPEAVLDAPRKVDPGPHLALATIDNATTETRFDLAEAETRNVAVPYPEVPPPHATLDASTPAPGELAVVSLGTPTRKNAPDAGEASASYAGNGQGSPFWSSPVPAYVALGVGGAGVVVTAVFGIFALHDKSLLDGACGADKTNCPSSSASDIRAMHESSIASDIGLGVALVGLEAGGLLLLFRRGGASPAPDKTSAVHVEPWLGPRGSGIRGSF